MVYDVIILGSGPAGLSAAVYARRACLSALVIEEKPLSGGQVLDTCEVDNYLGLPGIGGFELGQKFRAHADRLGAEFVSGRVTKIELQGERKLAITDKAEYESRTLVVATGAGRRKLMVPGEEEFAGLGVSYCATCDGAFFHGKNVAVVGGGDVALEDALLLSRGCGKIWLIHRREEFRGARSLQERVKKTENIELVLNSEVSEIRGGGQVTSLLVHNKLEGTDQELQAQGVFIAVGNQPNTSFLDGIVSRDKQGYIIAGEDTQTSEPGIFAAGDVRAKRLRQVVTAAADGANAIASAERYLAGN